MFSRLRSLLLVSVLIGSGSAFLAPQVVVAPTYDIIFAGGGAAASIIAGSLSAASPSLKILVLEGGPTTRDKLEHIQPARYFSHLSPYSTTEQFVVSNPSDAVAGRSIVIPVGKCIGGGSSVNFMLYNRASASDYDDWEVEYSNPGWGSKVLIPLLIKAETYEVNTPANPSAATHGNSGPLHVSYGGNGILPIAQQFLNIGPQVEKNRPLGPDGNDFTNKSINVFYRMPKWIGGVSGTRSDAPHHYLYTQQGNPNLVVSEGSRVTRVLFDSTLTATGVEFVYDKHVFPDYDPTPKQVTAGKLVVLSAGAMNTPQILERSGIGATSILKSVGVKQLVNLPGVGATYKDHVFLVSPYFADPTTPTFDNIFRSDPATWTQGLAQWDFNHTGIVASNGVDAAIKMRPTTAELAEIGPEFTARWNSFYANKTDKPLFWMSALAGLPADQTGLPVTSWISGGVFLGYPESVGSIHISSATDVYAPANYSSGFLTAQSDVAALRWGYKKAREIIRRMPAFRGALVPAHPQFAANSPAALTETQPVALTAPNIVYSAADDAAIDANIRAAVGTSWHSFGTAPMKPLAQGGVVDPSLNVYGVKKLKIADVSIGPEIVNANTYSTAIAIGSNAFKIIAAELGIKTT
ncbi:alcohol oxidase [Mycena alexandri]|uniref:Alcohol oxidase n=1 Tax=Mycena alexandri TaxID=1745969 RepID=A0AAD6XFA9_9AGAR|nr:alcohol oxidase [Mycena alexandri]